MFTSGVFNHIRERLIRDWPTPDTMPRIEPVDPPASVLAAMSATPVTPEPVEVPDADDFLLYPGPLAGYHAQETGHEFAVLDDLADRIAEGMSPLAAAQERFGGPRV